MCRGLMRAQNLQQQCSKVIHVNHFQSLILAHVQCIAQCTSSPIINSQAAELINSYRAIWTAISQLVLHNCGALLNRSLCQKKITVQTCTACCCWPPLLCTALHLLGHSSQLCNCGLACSRASPMQSHISLKQQPRVQCFQYFCFH